MKNYKDNLTGINNMQYLEDKYGKYIKKHKSCYIIAADFTKLKYINDNYGHKEGDNCIKLFAKETVRYFEDSIVVRRSGDEFIILTKYNKEEIEKRLNLIYKRIIEEYKNEEIRCAFSFNSGIKELDDEFYLDLHKADTVLYEAKSAGILYCFYEQEKHYNLCRISEILKSIDEMIKHDNIEYVPVLMISNGDSSLKMMGFEIKAKEITKFFEENKPKINKDTYRLKELDRYHLKKVIEYKDLNSSGYIRNINIYGSTIVSADVDFVDYFKDLIEKNGFEYNNICISINLNGTINIIDDLIRQIIRLKKLGIKIGVTGYSVKKEFPILYVLSKVNIDYMELDNESLLLMMPDNSLAHIMRQYLSFLNKYNIKVIKKQQNKQ